MFLAFHLLRLCTSSARLRMFLLPMIVIDLVPSTTQFLVSPFLPTYVVHTGPSITTNFTFLNFSPESVNTPDRGCSGLCDKFDNQWKAKPGRVEEL